MSHAIWYSFTLCISKSVCTLCLLPSLESFQPLFSQVLPWSELFHAPFTMPVTPKLDLLVSQRSLRLCSWFFFLLVVQTWSFLSVCLQVHWLSFVTSIVLIEPIQWIISVVLFFKSKIYIWFGFFAETFSFSLLKC